MNRILPYFHDSVDPLLLILWVQQVMVRRPFLRCLEATSKGQEVCLLHDLDIEVLFLQGPAVGENTFIISESGKEEFSLGMGKNKGSTGLDSRHGPWAMGNTPGLLES